MKTYGGRLDYACDLAGLPALNQGRQVELAKRMEVSVESARKWLNDESIPRPEKTEELSRVLGVSPAWLAFGVGEPKGKILTQTSNELLDSFACAAMSSLLIAYPQLSEKDIAEKSYSLGRAMLVARDKQKYQ